MDETEKKKPKKNLNETSNKENVSSLINYYTNDCNYNTNISFPSFENENNGSVIIKTYENENEKNSNSNINCNIFTQLEKNNIKNPSLKSFIPIVNTLKFVKEKEENATPSYLLALGVQNGNNHKNEYIQKGQIIEEEKSEMLITESELSNKKKIKKNTDYISMKFKNNLKNYNNYQYKNNNNGSQNFINEKKNINEENNSIFNYSNLKNKGGANLSKENEELCVEIKFPFYKEEKIVKGENEKMLFKKTNTNLDINFLQNLNNYKMDLWPKKLLEIINIRNNNKFSDNNYLNNITKKNTYDNEHKVISGFDHKKFTKHISHNYSQFSNKLSKLS
jgi:hypothetical protein